MFTSSTAVITSFTFPPASEISVSSFDESETSIDEMVERINVKRIKRNTQ